MESNSDFHFQDSLIVPPLVIRSLEFSKLKSDFSPMIESKYLYT
jgi:hypothetical protein